MQGYAKVAVYSCLLNLLLVGVKYSLGEISGSLALKADAIHSLADVVSALTIFVGIVISDRKTKTFPEGLYKVENLVALFSSLFIFYAAYEITSEAILGEASGPLEHVPVVIGGILFIILTAFLFSRYELRVGLEVGSPSLVADAKHVKTDLLSSLVILFGILGTSFGYPIDRYVALLVAVLVARMGYRILIESLKVLLDATLDHATLVGIRKILESHPDVTEVVSVGGRSSGRYKFVEVTLRLDIRLLREAHRITSDLEEEILDHWPNIDRLLIHYEPEQKDVVSVAAPLDVASDQSPTGTSGLSEHFGDARYFAIISKHMHKQTASIERFLENPFRDLEHRKGVKVAELLAEQGIDEVRTVRDLESTGAGYALLALEVDVFLTRSTTVAELLAELENEFCLPA